MISSDSTGVILVEFRFEHENKIVVLNIKINFVYEF
jgi:hypothetical protein